MYNVKVVHSDKPRSYHLCALAMLSFLCPHYSGFPACKRHSHQSRFFLQQNQLCRQIINIKLGKKSLTFSRWRPRSFCQKLTKVKKQLKGEQILALHLVNLLVV